MGAARRIVGARLILAAAAVVAGKLEATQPLAGALEVIQVMTIQIAIPIVTLEATLVAIVTPAPTAVTQTPVTVATPATQTIKTKAAPRPTAAIIATLVQTLDQTLVQTTLQTKMKKCPNNKKKSIKTSKNAT